MEQRPLRLGDIVDDYCPRERRVTNHAVVALVGEGIRQTRCTTCDAEHVYKGGKAPRRRLVGKDPEPVPPPAAEPAQPMRLAAPESNVTHPDPKHDPVEVAGDPDQPAAADAAEPPAEDAGPWITHRQLIRATLPRVEGELPAPRPIPEFTMHQRPQGRGHRHFGGWGHGQNGAGNGNANGNVNGNVNSNHNGFRHGRPGRNGGRPDDMSGNQGHGGRRHNQGKQRRPR